MTSSSSLSIKSQVLAWSMAGLLLLGAAGVQAQVPLNVDLTVPGSLDASGASATAPVKSGTLAQRPATCTAQTAYYNQTDASLAGQRLFVCNATGDGWVLVGDGGVWADETAVLTLKTLDLASNTLTGTATQFQDALQAEDFVFVGASQVVTGKRLPPRVVSSATLSEPWELTPDLAVASRYVLTALDHAITIHEPVGTPAPTDGEIITVSVYGASAYAVDFDDDNDPATGYVSIGLPLPTTTVAGQQMLWAFQYDARSGTWPFVGSPYATGPLAVLHGGTGTGSTLTGLMRGSATAMTAAELSGAVTTSGSNATTLATPYTLRTCELHLWGTGASSVLQDTDDEVASCYNATGVTVTVTAVACWANASTPTVLPKVTGASGNLLTGNLTCGTASFASGTVTDTTADKQIAAGGTVDANIVTAGGVATNLRLVVVYSVPAS